VHDNQRRRMPTRSSSKKRVERPGPARLRLRRSWTRCVFSKCRNSSRPAAQVALDKRQSARRGRALNRSGTRRPAERGDENLIAGAFELG
jgi:hypothetical protein